MLYKRISISDKDQELLNFNTSLIQDEEHLLDARKDLELDWQKFRNYQDGLEREYEDTVLAVRDLQREGA